MPKCKGFTLIELMVSIAIFVIIASIAIPNLSSFIIQTRVDNEIYQLQRLLFIARNHAIHLGVNVTVCPLGTDQQCNTQWQNDISVFIDLNQDKRYDVTIDERLITVKSAINPDDKLQYGIGRNTIIYAPTGQLSGYGQNGTFKYCPSADIDLSRGIVVARSGRLYITTDIDNDGKDENRSYKEIICRE
jgi:type IV fimbrial biogenesis protein FimT